MILVGRFPRIQRRHLSELVGIEENLGQRPPSLVVGSAELLFFWRGVDHSRADTVDHPTLRSFRPAGVGAALPRTRHPAEIATESVARASSRRRLFQFGAASWMYNSVGFDAVATVPHLALLSSSALPAASSPSGKIPPLALLLLLLIDFRRRLGSSSSSSVMFQPVPFGCHVPRHRYVD